MRLFDSSSVFTNFADIKSKKDVRKKMETTFLSIMQSALRKATHELSIYVPICQLINEERQGRSIKRKDLLSYLVGCGYSPTEIDNCRANDGQLFILCIDLFNYNYIIQSQRSPRTFEDLKSLGNLAFGFDNPFLLAYTLEQLIDYRNSRECTPEEKAFSGYFIRRLLSAVKVESQFSMSKSTDMDFSLLRGNYPLFAKFLHYQLVTQIQSKEQLQEIENELTSFEATPMDKLCLLCHRETHKPLLQISNTRDYFEFGKAIQQTHCNNETSTEPSGTEPGQRLNSPH